MISCAYTTLEMNMNYKRYFIRCVYLASQKEALTHVSDTDHETRSALMIGDHSMLTELHRLTTFLRPCYLHTQNESINALLDLRELHRSQKYIFFNQILFQFRTTVPPGHPNTVKQILANFRVAFYCGHTSAIIMLSNHHLDMPHL